MHGETIEKDQVSLNARKFSESYTARSITQRKTIVFIIDKRSIVIYRYIYK